MIGHLDKETFDPDKNYDQFYAGHKFSPLDEDLAVAADLMLPRVAWALDIAEEIGARNVLDLCCLDGFASLTITNRLGIPVVGVDLSEPGIKLANERAKRHNFQARYMQLAIEDLKSHKFDLVLLLEAIEHFKDVDKVMAVIKQHLNPGGTLLISTPDADGMYGIGNDDPCHLRIYSHKPGKYYLDPNFQGLGTKPLISLPDYLAEQGFQVVTTDVFNDLIHCRAVLP